MARGRSARSRGRSAAGDSAPDFTYLGPFPLGPDPTRYCLLTSRYVSVASFAGREILKLAPEALTLLAREAFRVVSFHYRASHPAMVAAVLDDPDASPNDRGVTLSLLKNAVVAARGRLPMCQDTGTAIIMAKKGQRVWTDVKDEEWLARGISRRDCDSSRTKTNGRW